MRDDASLQSPWNAERGEGNIVKRGKREETIDFMTTGRGDSKGENEREEETSKQYKIAVRFRLKMIVCAWINHHKP